MGSWITTAFKWLVKFGPLIYKGAKIVLPVIWEFRRTLPANKRIKDLEKEEEHEPVAPAHPP